MNIGLDIDEVVLQIMPEILALLNKSNDTNYTLDDVTSYNLSCIGLDKNKTKELFYNNRSNIFIHAPQEKDCKHYLTQLKNDGHNLIYITARSFYDEIEQDTIEWFENNEIPYDKVLVGKKDKGTACLENNIDIYFDDYDKNIEDVINKDIPGFVFDKPWNKHTGLPKVYNWKDIYNVIKYKKENQQNGKFRRYSI